MGSGPSIPAPVMHLLNAVSLGIFVGIMVKIGCEKTGKCRNPRDIELNLPPCNGQVGTNFPCLWTTNTGHQFVSVPSIDVYVKDFQVAWTATANACVEKCATTQGCVGSRYTDGGSCFLTGSLPAGATTDISGLEQILGMSADDITTSMGIKPFPTLRSCPADFDNYCTSSSPDASCITPNGFTIRCNRGVLGNNMSDEKQDPNSVTLLGCLDSCKNTDGCVAVAFMKDEGTAQGLCSLKDTVYAGVVDKAFIGAYVNDGEDGQLAAE